MEKAIAVFYSNRIEELYENLKKILFSKGSNPFAKKIIIVPSLPMKNFLMRKMAEDPDLKVAFGLEITYLNKGFDFLYKSMFVKDFQKKIPTFLELSLALEQQIEKILKSNNSSDLFSPLLDYFEGNEGKKRKKLTALSKELTRLFMKYGEFGAAFLKDLESEKSWQGYLWQALFGKDSPWTYPYALLQRTNIKESPFLEIHLFGLSYFSRIKHLLFVKIGKSLPVFYWLLSPCQTFWSDIRSEKESAHLISFFRKKGVQESYLSDLHNLLLDSNPLLANFGKLGREFAEELSECQILDDSCYLVSEGVTERPEFDCSIEIKIDPNQKKLTLLHAVQADLATMRKPLSKVKLSDTDRSIQIHSASSKLREVEVIYQALLNLIQQSDEPIEPKDIIALSPDISVYAPYIKMVFGRADSLLDFQIMDLHFSAEASLTQCFIKLLDLAGARWEVSEVLQIFSYPFFQKKHGFNEEDLAELKKWTEKTSIEYGLDLSHQNEIIKAEGFDPLIDQTNYGTWEKGFDLLLQELIFGTSNDEDDKLTVEFSKAEFFGKAFFLLKELRQDLKPLSSNASKNLKDWVHYFTLLLEKYLLPEFCDDALEKEHEVVKRIIDQFQKAALDFSEAEFPASSILGHLKSNLKTEEMIYREKVLQGVRFSSLLPMRSVPAKVVLLLGLDGESFPRPEVKSSLDQLKLSGKGDFCPSQNDYDRYLFIEALLSARKFFILSYQSIYESNGKKSSPSLLLTEFLEYLNNFYLIGEQKATEALFFEHPFHPFDKSYFDQSFFPSNSQRDYKAALAYYKRAKAPSQALIRSFKVAQVTVKREEIVNLRRLSALARHPIRAFLNRSMNIYLNKEMQKDSALELSHLDRFLIKKEALRSPKEIVLKNSEKRGRLPKAPFKELAKSKMECEIENLEKAFEKLGINRAEIFSVEFLDGCKYPQKIEEKKWILPPKMVAQTKIVGKIPFIAPQGLILFGQAKLTNKIKNFPECLLFSSLTEDLCEKKILYLEEEEEEKVDVFDSHSLETFLDYYHFSSQNISPLLPEWTKAFLENSADELEKGIHESLKGLYFSDPYITYSLNAELLPELTELLYLWHPISKRIYGKL